MSPLVAERADALLEGQETLVDLGPFHPRLAVGALGVLPSLITCKINEREFAVESAGFLCPYDDLEYSV